MVSQHSAAAAPMTADANLREQVQQRLRLDIVSGEIGPGTILSVPGLARTLGISTTPVREALRDAMETEKNVVGVHGIYNMTKDDHSGTDDRARVMVQVKNGNWQLMQ